MGAAGEQSNADDRGEVYDGRHKRRSRNRSAVIWSYVDLLREGVSEPTRPQLADRAGVSTRSTYRYFPHDDELIAAVAEYVVATFHPALAIPDIGQGSLHDRIGSFVDIRLSMYHRTAPITRASRLRRGDDASVVAAFERIRQATRKQLAQHFAPELERLASGQRERTITAMHAPFLFDSLEYVHSVHAGDEEAIREVFCRQLRAHLEHGMSSHC